MSTNHQDLSNDTTFNQIKSRVPVPLSEVRSVSGLKTWSKCTIGSLFLYFEKFLLSLETSGYRKLAYL